jgi:hypothetical protein
VVDINAWGALAAAEQWGGPWASFCPYPLALRSPQVPPFGPGLSPARGPLGHIRDLLARPLVVGTTTPRRGPAVLGATRDPGSRRDRGPACSGPRARWPRRRTSRRQSWPSPPGARRTGCR